MGLHVAYFQPTIVAIDQVPPVEFSKIFSLTSQLHEQRSLHEPDHPFLNIRGGQMISLFPNKLNLDVSWLVQYLETMCKGYMELVAKQSGTEDLTMCAPEIVSIWTIKQEEGHYQEMHSHPAGHLSGNLYVSVPELAEGSNPSDGQISLRMPFTKDVSKFILNDTWKNTPQPGTLMLFPSYIPHTVYPWKGSGSRIVVSFDARLVPKAEILERFKNG